MRIDAMKWNGNEELLKDLERLGGALDPKYKDIDDPHKPVWATGCDEDLDKWSMEDFRESFVEPLLIQGAKKVEVDTGDFFVYNNYGEEVYATGTLHITLPDGPDEALELVMCLIEEDVSPGDCKWGNKAERVIKVDWIIST